MTSLIQIRFLINLIANDSTFSCKIKSSNTTEISLELTTELKKSESLVILKKILDNHSKSNFVNFSYRKNYRLTFIKLGNDFVS